MLHTWSLAVEEEFYLLLPVLIWLIAKIRWSWSVGRCRLGAFACLGTASFLYSSWAISKSPMANFYLLGGRAWEFFLDLPYRSTYYGNPARGRGGSGLGLGLLCLALFT